MLLRLAIAVLSFETTLLRRACFSSGGIERWGFRLTPHASPSRANHKHFVSLIRSRCFVAHSLRNAASSVPAQATWLRPTFASISPLVWSGLRLVAVHALCHHRPN